MQLSENWFVDAPWAQLLCSTKIPDDTLQKFIVMSDEMGCWSELEIINENRFIDEKTKKLIIDKIAKYELYGMSGGESPMLEVKEKSGRISYYHLVKLPSDTWRID